MLKVPHKLAVSSLKLKRARKSWSKLAFAGTLAGSLLLSALVPLSAVAQTNIRENTGPTTILPTDIVPLQDRDAFKTPMTELLQLKMMQRLPSQLYFSTAIELTMRDETNPFQFPTKRALMAQLPRPAIWRTLNATQQAGLYDIIGQVARNQLIFRSLPNLSMGWSLDPHTRFFTNYFMIRDQLTHNMRLNTVIHSYAIGLQHDKPIGSKGSLQFEFQGRELWQLHQQSVFDFLPSITYTHILTPRTVLFVNALMQLRGKAPFQAPTKELDPFYTWGGLYQKNGWTFTATSTLVQNFREPFHSFATIPKNNYVIISDFEIARRMIKQYPGLQAFVRAEPIWNFKAHNLPSLSGMDFRMFFGMRYAMAKPALTSTLQQIREQLKQDTEPEPTPSGKPSASAPNNYEISLNPQPIHGFLETSSLAETCQNPFSADGDSALIAEAESEPDTGGKAAAETDEPGSGSGSEIADAIEADQDRTLEKVAQSVSQNASPEISKQESQPPIVDLAAADLDWTGINEPQISAAVGDKTELNTVIESAVEKSSELAMSSRIEELKTIQKKQEQEYKVAFAPVKPLSPALSVKPQAGPIPAFKAAVPKGGTIPVPSAKAVAQELTLQALPAPGLTAKQASLPEPATLARRESKITTPAGQPSSSRILADNLASTLKTPELKTLETKRTAPIQPMGAQPFASMERTHPGQLKPSKIVSQPHIQEPVQLNSALSAAPNKVPSPIPALADTTAVKQVSQEPVRQTKAAGELLASASVPDLRLPAVAAQNKAATKTASVQTQTPKIEVNKALKAARPTLKLENIGTGVSKLSPQVNISPLSPEISAAVSSLGENEITSPKIAMAVYENWTLPLMDDPLIKTPGPGNSRADLNFSTSQTKKQRNKSTDKNPTSMKLIPPFPSPHASGKDSPLKDIKVPVLPLH